MNIQALGAGEPALSQPWRGRQTRYPFRVCPDADSCTSMPPKHAGSVDSLSTSISARKVLKIIRAKSFEEADEPLEDDGKKQRRAAVNKDKASSHSYCTELDSDFYQTAFEVYHVSKRTKRFGGGAEMGAASTWCGNLTIGVRHCNWIQKMCYGGTGSARKFGDDCLIYLGSRDGFSNREFHRKCDLKGPTITIVYTADGRLFGGYASTPWSAGTTGKYSDDPSAFLFSLTHGKDQDRPGVPIKLLQSNSSPADAVFHDSDLGPCFGRALALQLGIKQFRFRFPPPVSVPLATSTFPPVFVLPAPESFASILLTCINGAPLLKRRYPGVLVFRFS
jgi:hypothetical protein